MCITCRVVFKMKVALAVVFSCVLVCGCVAGSLDFPPGFKFGAASSAYQVEGAWNVSDKTPSIWDVFTDIKPSRIEDGSNGDIACDSYRLWEEDVKAAKELGLDFYRFSISWPRLLPSGFPDKISEDGKNYYNNLIDALLAEGIEPMVTIFHWDLPQRFQDLGGWANPLITDWFAEYARTVYTLYAPKVKLWITINEPFIVCGLSYSSGDLPPNLKDLKLGYYLCNKNMLIAHAKAWRIYDEEFRTKYHGKVSLTQQFTWFEPLSEEHEEITELANQYAIGRYSHPIFSKEGGWPPIVERHIAELSAKEGFSRSRLPEFNKEEIELVKGTYDFFALNYYTSRKVRSRQPGDAVDLWPYNGGEDLPAITEVDKAWPETAMGYVKIFPEGLRKALGYLKRNYGDLEFIITENGLATTGSNLEDHDRIKYHRDHLQQILLAIKQGINVTGYTAWTLIDNFEWTYGYSLKFGLYEVDFTSPQRPRTPRRSARFYADVIRRRSLDFDEKDEL